jgi:hypothetical protein
MHVVTTSFVQEIFKADLTKVINTVYVYNSCIFKAA